MAAGKSEALAALGRLGAATLSADRVVHELYDQPAVRDAVIGRWGEGVRDGNRIDRRAVARRVFGSDAERVWLEGLLWPRVGKAIDEWHTEQNRRQPPPAAIVVEVPLLFEAGMDALFDCTIAVIADDAVRAERAAARGHGTVDERAARQLSQADKARRADHVVVNSGTIADLEQSLAGVLAKLRG